MRDQKTAFDELNEKCINDARERWQLLGFDACLPTKDKKDTNLVSVFEENQYNNRKFQRIN